jgi:hypothetical protein
LVTVNVSRLRENVSKFIPAIIDQPLQFNVNKIIKCNCMINQLMEPPPIQSSLQDTELILFCILMMTHYINLISANSLPLLIFEYSFGKLILRNSRKQVLNTDSGQKIVCDVCGFPENCYREVKSILHSEVEGSDVVELYEGFDEGLDLLVGLVDGRIMICRLGVPIALNHMSNPLIKGIIGPEISFLLNQLTPQRQILGMIGNIFFFYLLLLTNGHFHCNRLLIIIDPHVVRSGFFVPIVLGIGVIVED